MLAEGTTGRIERRAGAAWCGRQQLALGVLLIAIVCTIVVEWWHRQPAPPSELAPSVSTAPCAAPSASGSRAFLDLNRADTDALITLPGIGPTLAQRIVAYRQEHGPFRQVEELRRVPGIGAKTFDKIRGLVYVEPGEGGPVGQPTPDQLPVEGSGGRQLAIVGERVPAQTPVPTPQRQPIHTYAEESTGANRKAGASASAHRRNQLPSEPVDLNRASREELMSLPAIGPVLADRIIAERQTRGPFLSVEDLRRVRGIGPRILDRLRPFVRVELSRAQVVSME
ncbi:MAG: helix-hairpin-helix domain-containing protein [Gemmatales bacterium]|nr:helix-hairpin-helix domain-containing protein [Gemmatales bacterium]